MALFMLGAESVEKKRIILPSTLPNLDFQCMVRIRKKLLSNWNPARVRLKIKISFV